MNLSILDQIIVVLYLAAIMSIGFAMKRKAAKGMSSYFLGGRQLPWWALAMSGSSSYFDITGTMWIVSTFIGTPFPAASVVPPTAAVCRVEPPIAGCESDQGPPGSGCPARSLPSITITFAPRSPSSAM